MNQHTAELSQVNTVQFNKPTYDSYITTISYNIQYTRRGMTVPCCVCARARARVCVCVCVYVCVVWDGHHELTLSPTHTKGTGDIIQQL